MTNLILTNNTYLKIALENLKSSFETASGLIFVDISSFYNLADMMNAINLSVTSDDARVCLIGTSCINFKLFNPFNPISMDDSYQTIEEFVANRKFKRVYELKTFITALAELSMFTHRQKRCLLAFKTYGDVYFVSRQMKVSVKTVYVVIRNAGYKINLTRLIHMREFLSANSFS